jgi:hypothetical protein
LSKRALRGWKAPAFKPDRARERLAADDNDILAGARKCIGGSQDTTVLRQRREGQDHDPHVQWL